MVPNPIKMIIWDLDDTFWHGTLTEEEVTVPQRNIDIVKLLAERGIVSSICSKNNYADARRVLEQHAVWFYFVLPRIEFAAKGAAIAALIDQANLRADNVLFIDDNRLNLEEARHYAPNIMTASPEDILPVLLDLPQAAGKNDSNLTRLHQYKQLERKTNDLNSSSLSNADFLRACDVRVKIDLNVEEELDRVIELINRSNQLNFTKVRVESEADRATFKRSLREYGIHAGIVRATDKYGDYGIIGFFMMTRRAGTRHLKHFVFSCRTMNMGIEQYVHEMLGKPTCRIVPPVANGLECFPTVDWIRPPDEGPATTRAISDSKLLLMGGCDLLQVATYCSTNRVEYVNDLQNGVMVRYDDPGFVLTSRDLIKTSTSLPRVPCWTKESALRFDKDLGDVHTVIVSLWEALNGKYMVLDEEILIRLAPGGNTLERHVHDHPELYTDRCAFIRLTVDQRLALVTRSLDQIAQRSPNAQARFVLGVNTKRVGRKLLEVRTAYNASMMEYCVQHKTFTFINVDEIVPDDELLDGIHYSRKGYFAIASKLIESINARGTETVSCGRPNPIVEPDFHDVIRRAEHVNADSI